MNRIDKIQTALQVLQPTQLEIIDDSAAHAGHAGAASGRGHFHVKISSPALHGLTRVAQHRRVYEALGDLMQTDIHALAIEIRS